MATVENRIASNTVFAVLISVTVCHLINDTLQALMLAIYPILRDSYALTFGQIGMITHGVPCHGLHPATPDRALY